MDWHTTPSAILSAAAGGIHEASEPPQGDLSVRYNPPVHFVYIVRCADGTLYTGYARNPLERERAHNSGRGAKYTAGRRPVQLVYQEAFRTVGKALAREYVVKQLTRAQKDALVAGGKRRPLRRHLQKP